MMRVGVVLVVLALAGCGEEAARTTVPIATMPTEPPPNDGVPLTKKEASVIGVAVTAARVTCLEEYTSQLPPGRLEEVVDDLIALAEKGPDHVGSAFGERPNTPRNGLEQVAEQLEEDDCRPELAARVRRVLDGL